MAILQAKIALYCNSILVIRAADCPRSIVKLRLQPIVFRERFWLPCSSTINVQIGVHTESQIVALLSLRKNEEMPRKKKQQLINARDQCAQFGGQIGVNELVAGLHERPSEPIKSAGLRNLIGIIRVKHVQEFPQEGFRQEIISEPEQSLVMSANSLLFN